MQSIFPKHARDVIIRPIPEVLIKEREGGGKKKLSYLSGQTIIDMLNQAFSYMWSWEATKEWIQESQPKFNPKYDKEPQYQGPVAHVKGLLKIHIPDGKGSYFELIKSGYGSKAVLGSQIDQESVFKAAGTDALKKAASLFGIGLELYRDEEEQIYFEEMNYEDPWNDEALEKYDSSRKFIKEFVKSHELDQEDINALVENFSDGVLTDIGDIVPDNIESFVSYLQEQAEAAAAETVN